MADGIRQLSDPSLPWPSDEKILADLEGGGSELNRLRALLAQAEKALEQASDYLHDIPESAVGGDDEGTRVAGVVRRVIAAIREEPK